MNYKKPYIALYSAFLLLFVVSSVPTELLGIELRKEFFIRLLNGSIQFLMLSLASFFMMRYFILDKDKTRSIIYLMATIMFLGLSYLFYTFDLKPDVKEDRIIYQNKLNKSEKLVFQYYETGIGGNPHWKGIITKNISGNIRTINSIDLSSLRRKLDFHDHSIDIKELPSEIEINKKVFKLEKVILFGSDSVINIKQ